MAYSYRVEAPRNFGSSIEALKQQEGLLDNAKLARKEIASLQAGVKALQVTLSSNKEATRAQITTIFSSLKEVETVVAQALPVVRERATQVMPAPNTLPFVGRVVNKVNRFMHKEFYAVSAAQNELEKVQAQIAKAKLKAENKQTEFTSKTDALALNTRSKTLEAPKESKVTYQELKEGMPDVKSVTVNGKRQNSPKELFTALEQLFGMAHDESRINARLETFGDKQGSAPESFAGDTRDLQALKYAAQGQFSLATKALADYCKQKEFRLHNTSGHFFVAGSGDKDRTVSFAKSADGDVVVTIKTKTSLLRKEGDESYVATLTVSQVTTLGADGTAKSSKFVISDIKPTMNLMKYDFKRLELFAPEQAEIIATEAQASAN